MILNIRLPAQARSKSCLFIAAAVIMIVAASLSGCVPWPNSPDQQVTPTTSATRITFPDLIVDTVQTNIPGGTSCSDPAAGISMLIQLRNQGNGAAGPFEVLVNGRQTLSSPGLAAGDTIELTLEGFTADLKLEIDQTNQIQESDETNNFFQIQVPPPTLPENCQPTATVETAYQEASYTMQGHTSKVLSVTFSPDGNLVASGSIDNTVRLWRVKEGSLLRTMTGHPFQVTEVVFSPNGANLATGSSDGNIRIWSVSNGLLLKTLQAHGGAITDLLYTPDNRRLLSSAEDFTVRAWNPADGRLLKTIDEGMAVVKSLVSSKDGENIIWAEGDGSLKILRLVDGAWLKRWGDTQQPATSLALSPDESLLVVGFQDGQIQVWKLPEGELLATINAHHGNVTDLVFSPDGKWLASSSDDSSIRLWSVSATQPVENLSNQAAPLALSEVLIGHTGPVKSVAFSPKGNLLASGGNDGAIRLWAVPVE